MESFTDYPIMSLILLVAGATLFVLSRSASAGSVEGYLAIVQRNRIAAFFMIVFALVVRMIWGW